MPETEEKIRAPELEGGTWLNSEPVSMESLRGRPVLVDFWDYTCVNCIRTLPYVREWHNRYGRLGVQVIGVHAPEFTFARETSAVREALESFGLTYPVVMDNDYQIWKAFDNHYWPAKYLVDAEGLVRYYHFGERGYDETEHMLQKLVRETQADIPLPPPMTPVREDDRPGAVCYAPTPELYAGYQRGRIGNPHGVKPEQPAYYRDLGQHAEGFIYLEGQWVVSGEFAAFYGQGTGPGRLTIRYTSKEVNLVMNPLREPGRAVLLQDGEPVPEADRGDDVKSGDGGATEVVVTGPRMYRLLNNRDFGSHELTLQTESPGLAVYAFTFISCVAA